MSKMLKQPADPPAPMEQDGAVAAPLEQTETEKPKTEYSPSATRPSGWSTRRLRSFR